MNKLKNLNNLDDIKLTKEFVFLNPYKFIAYFIYGILALLIGVCVFLSFTDKEETIDVQGYLQLSDKLQDIQVLVDGVVDTIYVNDGEYVEKGDTILSLQSSKLSIEKEDLQKKLDTARKQQEYLTRLEYCIKNKKNTFENNEEEGYYYAQVNNYLTQINSLNSSISTGSLTSLNTQKKEYQELLNAMQNDGTLSSSHSQSTTLKLYKSQISTFNDKIAQIQELLEGAQNPSLLSNANNTIIMQYQQQLTTLNTEKQSFIDQQQLSVQQQIDALNQQINQAKNANQEAEQKVKMEISNLTASSLVEVKNQSEQLQTAIKGYEASLSSIDSDLNYYILKASESGYIRFKGEIKKDYVLSSGSVIGILTAKENEPENFQVTLNVPSSGIGFVEGGQNVKITVDGLDSREYGYINGNIKKIYETPIQTENSVYYLVETSVDLQSNEGIYRELFNLKDDMSVKANVVTKKTSWMTYILQKVNIFKDEDIK